MFSRHSFASPPPPVELASSEGCDFRLLFSVHPQPTWIYDVDTHAILDANEAACHLYGYPRAEFLALRQTDLFWPAAAGAETGTAPEPGAAVPHRTREGRPIGVDAIARPVEFAGRPAMLVTALDLGARREAERRLRASQEQYRTVVDNVEQVIFQTDARGRFTFLNAAWTDVTGFAVEESLGEGFLHYVHPEDRQRHAELFQPLIERRDDYIGLRARYLTKTGGVRWLDVYARLTLEGEGLVTGIFGTLTDVTERRRAEEDLSAARARLRHLLAASPAIIYSAQLAEPYAITFVSENVSRLLGWEPSDFLEGPRLWATHVHPEDWPGVAAGLAGLDALEHQSLEYRFRCRDGTYRWVQDERRVVRDASGRPTEVAGSWLDITERRAAEAAGSELASQLRQAQKLEAIGRLAGGVAHDFNNVLTVVTGRAELLLRRLPDETPLTRDVELILRTSERAAALTRQLLAFSRKQVLAPRVIDLDAVVAHMERMLRRLIGEDVDLVMERGPDLGRVKADPGQIEQVLMNLAVNARDAMPRGGHLTIGTANADVDEAAARRLGGLRPGRHVVLTVSDTGCGMDAETMSHIFEPFFTTKGPEAGTGLGLATVYGIVKQSDGAIVVDSEPERGATFRIYLPRVEAPAAPVSERGGRDRYASGSETVLVVEDEDAVRKLAREILRISGYAVLEAAHGAAALELASQHGGPIHLLLSDVVMPEISGPELARRLTARRPETQVLFLSGYTEDALAHHGIVPSETGLLRKPFSPVQLTRRVREVLDGPRPAPGGRR